MVNHQLPAIEAIGGSVIYFVDGHKPFNNHWNAPLNNKSEQRGFGFY